MTKEEMQLALKEFKENLPSYATAEDLQKQMETFETMAADLDVSHDLAELKEAVEAQGLALNKIAEKAPKENETIESVLEANAEKILKVASKNLPALKFVVPKTEITTASVATPYQGMQIPGAGMMPHQAAVLRPLFNQANLSPGMNGTVYYTDQETDTNNAAGTAESATFKESVATWKGRSITIEKITDSFPVTYEALRDQSFIASEIRRLLNTHLRIKEDNYLWNGTGSTPIISGAYTTASAFDSASYTGFKPANANLFDLLAIMKVEISNGNGGMYRPNYAVMNPADILKMKLAKDSTSGLYTIPPFTMSNGQQVDGMMVVESESVTANTLLVGDFNFGTIYDDGGIEIEMGYSGTQFVEDVVTLKARKRMVLLIRNAYTGAFLKSTDIDTDIANITSGA